MAPPIVSKAARSTVVRKIWRTAIVISMPPGKSQVVEMRKATKV